LFLIVIVIFGVNQKYIVTVNGLLLAKIMVFYPPKITLQRKTLQVHQG